MVARVVPQSARRRHAESRKPDLRGVVARPKGPVLCRDLLAAAPHGLGTPDAHGGEDRNQFQKKKE